MKNMKKIIIAISFLILFIAFLWQVITNRDYKHLDKIEENSHNSLLAIYVKDGDKYKLYPGSEWPVGYQFVKYECYKDQNKRNLLNDVSLIKDGNSFLISTTKRAFCYLYFDK